MSRSANLFYFYSTPPIQLFIRPVAADNSLPDYDERAATALTQRVLSFLATIDQRQEPTAR